ncbi:MAG: NepR family anti-sigma factor [Hyphomonas sp.]
MARDDDRPGDEQASDGLPGLHRDGLGVSISRALQKAYDAMLDEPVPERLKDLIARIRRAEDGRDD